MWQFCRTTNDYDDINLDFQKKITLQKVIGPPIDADTEIISTDFEFPKLFLGIILLD